MINEPMWTHEEYFEMKGMRDAAWKRIEELEYASLEPLLQASNEMIKLRKQVKDLQTRVDDLRIENGNLRARLFSDFDMDADRPALVRRQAE